MKYMIVLCDGMADWSVKSLNNKTVMQYAHTPNMDMLARKGCTGQILTVPNGYQAGSEVANLSVLGYDVQEIYQGRASLEAVGMGIDLQEDDLVLRCNLVNRKNGTLNSHSAGDITTEEAEVLITCLQEHLGNDKIKFHIGKEYRHIVVIKGGKKQMDCTPPHDIVSKPYSDYLPKAETAEAEDTIRLMIDLMKQSQGLLASHPLNISRANAGKLTADGIWLWSPGYRPRMERFSTMYPDIQRGTIISATDLMIGVGLCAGFRCVKPDGKADSRYKNKVKEALSALTTDNFVYLHIDAPDEAGHAGDIEKKRISIENIDKYVIGPLYETVKDWEEPVSIAVLPDHPTPCEIRTHMKEAVPFLIYHKGIVSDQVDKFSEVDCAKGGYGVLKAKEFMNLFLGL